MRPFSLKKYLEYFKTGAVTTAKKSNTVFSIMNKTNMNYTAPEMEIISIETQNCFALGSSPSFSPGRFDISSDSGLGDLDEVSADWN